MSGVDSARVHRVPDEGTARCPYCRDLLGPDDGVQVIVCPGCRTEHHAGCIEELGRCTILGCERPLTPADLGPARRDTPAVRAVRARLRARARMFCNERARSDRLVDDDAFTEREGRSERRMLRLLVWGAIGLGAVTALGLVVAMAEAL